MHYRSFWVRTLIQMSSADRGEYKHTLIHMQSEKGKVAMMRMMETMAKRSAQQPGPSGSAEKKPYHYFS